MYNSNFQYTQDKLSLLDICVEEDMVAMTTEYVSLYLLTRQVKEDVNWCSQICYRTVCTISRRENWRYDKLVRMIRM